MLDQRVDRRFHVSDETRALAHNKIAKVIDISKGGISLLFLDESLSSINGEFCLDLFCEEKGLDTRQIPGRIVWDKEVSFSAFPGMVYKKVGVQFGKLSPCQHLLLKKLFLNSPD